MAADPPIVVADELAAEEMDTEAITSIARKMCRLCLAQSALTGLSEPTLRDLVAKLQTQPLANPEAILGRPGHQPSPKPCPHCRPAGREIYDPLISRLDRHETKFPLGGVAPAKEVAPANSIEGEKRHRSVARTPTSEEAPLPEKIPLLRRSSTSRAGSLSGEDSSFGEEATTLIGPTGNRPSSAALPIGMSSSDPDVFPQPGPDPAPDLEPVPLPPPDPDPGLPIDPLPTPAPVY